MGAVCGSDIAVDPKTHPVTSPPLSFHRVFSLCVCHASCCHLKLMNSNDFTARRHSVCMCCTVTGGRNSPSSSSTAGVCCGSETAGQSGNYYAALLWWIMQKACPLLWILSSSTRPGCVRIHSAPPEKMLLRVTSAETNGMPLWCKFHHVLQWRTASFFPILYFNSVLLKWLLQNHDMFIFRIRKTLLIPAEKFNECEVIVVTVWKRRFPF